MTSPMKMTAKPAELSKTPPFFREEKKPGPT